MELQESCNCLTNVCQLDSEIEGLVNVRVSIIYSAQDSDNIHLTIDNTKKTISATLVPIKYETKAEFPTVGSERLIYVDVSDNTLWIFNSDTGDYEMVGGQTDVASLIEENSFEGKQIFNAETEFNSVAEHNDDINLTDAVLRAIDTTADMVTQYSADEIVINENGNSISHHLVFPKKTGTLLTDSDISFKHSKIQNADTDTDKVDEWRITDPKAKIKLKLDTENDNSGISLERNYISMQNGDNNGGFAEAAVSANSIILEARDTSGTNSLNISSEQATLNGKDIITSLGGTFENRPKVQDNGTGIDVAIKSDLDNYVTAQSDDGTTYSLINNQNGQFSVHITQNGDNVDIHNLVINKDGIFIASKVKVQGDAEVSGLVTVKETETLKVKDNLIVTNAEGVELLDLSGLGIKKNATDVYGIVYDPASDSVKLGLGTISDEGKFAFSSGEGSPVALRSDSQFMVDEHLVKWNATNKKFIDCGQKLDVEATPNTIASRLISGALKSTPITDIDIEEQTNDTVATKKDISSKVDKVTTTASNYRVYAITPSGGQTTLSQAELGSKIIWRTW